MRHKAIMKMQMHQIKLQQMKTLTTPSLLISERGWRRKGKMLYGWNNQTKGLGFESKPTIWKRRRELSHWGHLFHRIYVFN